MLITSSIHNFYSLLVVFLKTDLPIQQNGGRDTVKMKDFLPTNRSFTLIPLTRTSIKNTTME